jgi:hypothetical protein
MIVWGGVDGSGTTYFDDGAAYDPLTNSWSLLPAVPAGISGRDAHVSVWTGAELVIWGGQNASPNNLADGVAYSPATNTWRKLASSALGGRAWAGAVLARSTGEVVVWGGRTTTEQNDGAAYLAPSDNWKPIAAAPIVGRLNPVITYLAGDVLVWGGTVSETNPLRDGARLSVAARTWTKLPDPPIEYVDRTWMSSAPTSTGFFAYGGLELVAGFPVHPDGLRYAAGAWTLVPPLDPAVVSPQPGFFGATWCSSSACWVWSGASGWATPMPLASGGARFDLSTSVWSAMPTSFAPSARLLPQVVWTGSYSLIWGGAVSATSAARDGAMFVP